MVAAAVGEPPAEQPHEGGGPVEQAVQETELEGSQAEAQDEVERQYRRDHLGGDVGDEADRAEREDGGGDAPPGPGGAGRRVRAAVGGQVHQWQLYFGLVSLTWPSVAT